jgi:hypothetical protein
MRKSLLIALALTGLLSGTAQAAPRLKWMLPCGGQRGTTFHATVSGAELDALNGVIGTGPGVTAKVLPPAAGQDAKTTRTLEVTVAPDAPLGKDEVRLYDPKGASNPKFFWVGQFPELTEKEPNDARSQAQRVELPATVNGQIGQGSDIDSYTFHLKKGEEMTAEIQSLRLLGELGDTWLKGYAWAEDSRGKLLAENNGYYRWDPYLQFVAPEDGDYTVSYRDVEYRGNPMGVYRLTLGVVPHLWSTFPLGGQRGATTAVRLLGANLGVDAKADVVIPPDAPEGLREERFQVGGVWTNYQQFVVSRYPSFVEQEPNNDWKAANRVTLPVEVQGILDRPEDVDSFIFTAKKGDRLALEVLSRRAEMPLDSVLTLRKADGTVIQDNDDDRDRDSRLDRTVEADGDYIVQIKDVDGRGGPAFVYRLSLTPPQPDFSLQAQDDKPVVKPGGTVTLDLTLNRRDGFDGDVTVTAEGLPAGITAQPLVIPKGKGEGKLTLSCAAGTAHQAVVLRLWGEATMGEGRERRLSSTTETYNIQGTAYRRDLIGPVLVVTP